MEKYDGVLSIKKMGKIEKKAYKSWKDQGQRCQNKNNPRFVFYGGKGIKREYEPREFISWFVVEYKKRESWICAQVDRIDSSKNYCFGNIRLIERSENVKFRNDEHGNPVDSEKIRITYPCGKILDFDSIREASRETGILRRTIQQRIRNVLKRKPKDDLIISTIR